MKLGVVSDISYVEVGDQIVTTAIELHQVACLCPYFDEVLFFVPSPPGFDPNSPELRRVPRRNMRVVPLPDFQPRRVRGLLPVARRIYKALKTELPAADLVNIRMPRLLGPLAKRACVANGLPHFASLHGDWAEQIRLNRLRSGLRRYTAHFAGLADTLTRYVCRDAVVFSTSADLLERVRPVIRAGFTTYSSLLDADTIAREAKALRPGQRYKLLYVGEIREHKGVWHLLEAMKLLTERGVDVELRLLGRGPLLEPGKQYAEQHGFADRCCFEGYVSHGPALFRFFQENDLFVFPSFSEGSPKVVLEALAFATPVVTTPVGAVSLVVQDGVQGVHTPIGDSAAVADAVAGILADANRYHQMSRACIDMAHRWTRSAVTERLIQQLTDTGLYTAPPALSEGSTNA